MDEIINRCVDNIPNDFDEACEDATPGATDCFDCFQKQFFDGNQIVYDCDPKIDIYVARYFPVHVKENMEALSLLPPEYIESLLQLDDINVMNIGGGPGSDSFAIKKFFLQNEDRGNIEGMKNIRILRIDKENNWNDIAGFVNQQISNSDRIVFNPRRRNCDIRIKKQWPKANIKYNIFTLSYFLSEIEENQIELIAEFINTYASDTASAIIINDNDRYKVNTLVPMLSDNISCSFEYENNDSAQHHCGFSYSDKDRDFVFPKLTTRSIRYVKVINL